MEKYFETICCRFLKASCKKDDVYLRTFRDYLPDLAECLERMSKSIRIGSCYLRDRNISERGILTVEALSFDMQRGGNKLYKPEYMEIRFNQRNGTFKLQINFQALWKWYSYGHPFELADMCDCRDNGSLDYVFSY